MFNQVSTARSAIEPNASAEDLLRAASVRFPAGHILDEKRTSTSSVMAIRVDYDRDYPVGGDWYSDDIHFFDMTLSARPPGSRGYFRETAGDYRALGKIFFMPAGHHFHGEGGPGRQQSLSLFLKARFAGEDALDFGENLTPVLPNCCRLESGVVQAVLTRILREVAQPSFASELLLEGLSLTLLVETARLLYRLRDRHFRKGGLSPRRLKTIEDRVRNGGRATSIAELAALCQLSRRHLIRAFRAETGETIGGFVQRLTTERAKSLLRGSEKPVAAIAAELGFATAAAFSAAFHRATGQSPRDFRSSRRFGADEAAFEARH
jgi:AraC family transcriptional regulator